MLILVIDNPDNDPLVVNDIDLSHDMEKNFTIAKLLLLYYRNFWQRPSYNWYKNSMQFMQAYNK